MQYLIRLYYHHPYIIQISAGAEKMVLLWKCHVLLGIIMSLGSFTIGFIVGWLFGAAIVAFILPYVMHALVGMI
jgi:hypothetical protein